ncbi:hypothetical protein T643_A1730 [Klebsiella pneumoniae MRSN 1319]|nr:hypothetical protein T643_A1730 [Klebsiella pneumoniae MRSN 1319]
MIAPSRRWRKVYSVMHFFFVAGISGVYIYLTLFIKVIIGG